MKLSHKDREGLWIWGVVISIAVLVIGIYIYVKNTRTEVDAANCPLLPGSRLTSPGPHTVFLIDQSEAFTSNQQAVILSRVNGDLVESLRVGERVSVFVFNKAQYFDLVPTFSQCVPPKDVNPLVGSRSRVKFFLEHRFVEPLRAAIASGFVEVGDESPILEALQSVGRSSHVDRRPGSSVRLIVVSDMLQHRAGQYTHYGRRPDYQAFRQSPYGKAVQPRLEGWDVSVYYVARYAAGKTDQGSEHLKFWQQVFFDSGAKLQTWEPVS